MKRANEHLKELQDKARRTSTEINGLKHFEKKYNEVRAALSDSNVVEDYFQPVILLGPRNVGKTSLLMQWHAPWDHGRLDPTQTHMTANVPVRDFPQTHRKKHFADPDISTKVDSHLKLRIHDFPGEIGAQRNAIEQAKSESKKLCKQGENLGIVLICMFDASELADEGGSGLTKETNTYYNGELFAKLRDMVAHQEVYIQRIILVFNKYDLLRKICPNGDDTDLLKRCVKAVDPILTPLHRTCNPDKVCEVFSVLDREDMVQNNRGAPIILGQAARGLVEAKAGASAARELIKEEPTRYSARNFPAY